jgi:lon-related putative ATP-dependent protease
MPVTDAAPAVEDDGPALLAPEQLYRKADLSALSFATTRELAVLPSLLGQKRAHDAIRFGANVAARGFNIFAVGASGARISPLVRRVLAEKPAVQPKLFDWVYVNNFAAPHQPIAIALPPGRALALQAALRKLVEDLRVTLPTLFESEEYQRRRSAIEESMRSKAQKMFTALGERAAARGVAIVRTPMGFTTAPMEKGAVVDPEIFNAWPEERRRQAQQAVHEIEGELEQTLRAMPRYEKERRDAVRALDQETARFAIGQEIEEARAGLLDLPAALGHLDAVQADLSDNIYLFLQQQQEVGPVERRPPSFADGLFERYDVNILVTHAGQSEVGPVIEELHPTLGNLFGRVEHIQVQGALVTNFRMIKPGALHRANGGTILIDARSLLGEPYSWAALKRALVQRKIVIEDLAHIIGFASTASLEPQPVPLDIKVILFGERFLYYLLANLDPEFAQHFKILADFDDEIDRSPENEALFARLVGRLASESGLRPLDRDAVALAVERAARLADDSSKLSLVIERVRDLVTEADHWAAESGREVIAGPDVERAVSEEIGRMSRLEERAREMVLRDVSMIATDGSRIGQVNGLSVVALGTHAFGRPARITARVRPGLGRIVDIEREVALGGPLHSKGVLILSGFIAGRYALDTPMSLYASLVFEQSYGGIEGDSASAAELCALLSALAEAPLRQDVAVTGSVNQHGDIQPIGGVNEKIEGFFDVCAARGLTGRQGVLIPASNVQHLMVRSDIVQACRDGRFAIRAMRTIDQAMAFLSGRPAGRRDGDHRYPEGSINRAVEDRLRVYASVRQKMAAEPKE